VAHWRWRTAGRGWEVGQEVEEGVLYSRNAQGPSGLAALGAAAVHAPRHAAMLHRTHVCAERATSGQGGSSLLHVESTRMGHLG
jgi:hypothetical protein